LTGCVCRLTADHQKAQKNPVGCLISCCWSCSNACLLFHAQLAQILPSDAQTRLDEGLRMTTDRSKAQQMQQILQQHELCCTCYHLFHDFLPLMQVRQDWRYALGWPQTTTKHSTCSKFDSNTTFAALPAVCFMTSCPWCRSDGTGGVFRADHRPQEGSGGPVGGLRPRPGGHHHQHWGQPAVLE